MSAKAKRQHELVKDERLKVITLKRRIWRLDGDIGKRKSPIVFTAYFEIVSKMTFFGPQNDLQAVSQSAYFGTRNGKTE